VVDEAGSTVQIDVVLDVAPLADVTITVDVDDGTEASVSPNGADARRRLERAADGRRDRVDDDMTTGPPWILTSIPAGAWTSSTRSWRDPDLGTTTDDDTAGLVLVGAVGAQTDEAAARTRSHVALTSQPTADVRLDLSSTDSGRGDREPGGG